MEYVDDSHDGSDLRIRSSIGRVSSSSCQCQRRTILTLR